MKTCIHTIEINEDTAIRHAPGCILEKRLAVGELLEPRRCLPKHVHEIPGVHGAVAEAEDSLVAAARPYMRIEQEHNRDDDDNDGR